MLGKGEEEKESKQQQQNKNKNIGLLQSEVNDFFHEVGMGN